MPNKTLTTEEILEQLFDDGYVFYEFKVGDKFNIKIRNLTNEDYIDINEKLKDLNTNNLGYTQNFILYKTAKVLVEFNNKKFNNEQDKLNFIKKLSTKLTDKILNEHKYLEEDIKKALELDEVEDHFFDQDGSPQNSKPSQKE